MDTFCPIVDSYNTGTLTLALFYQLFHRHFTVQLYIQHFDSFEVTIVMGLQNTITAKSLDICHAVQGNSKQVV